MYILVRYLREVNVLMQKQNPSSSPPHDNQIESNQKRNPTTISHQSSSDSMLYETKRISLRLCYVFRRSSSATDTLVLSSSSPPPTASPILTDGTNGSILDIVLPYTGTCYSIRFVDDMYARKWFYIIHSKISRCLLEILPEIEEYFYVTRNTSEINALGWLAEQVNQNEITGMKSWRPIFLVLTDLEICFLSYAPISKQTCREPDIVYPILCSR